MNLPSLAADAVCKIYHESLARTVGEPAFGTAGAASKTPQSNARIANEKDRSRLGTGGREYNVRLNHLPR
jgi:hypothetical protein